VGQKTRFLANFIFQNGLFAILPTIQPVQRKFLNQNFEEKNN
jgi:hypothetical protein